MYTAVPCVNVCGLETANKLSSINALRAAERSSLTETYEPESTVAACPAMGYRESPGLCLFVSVCVCRV